MRLYGGGPLVLKVKTAEHHRQAYSWRRHGATNVCNFLAMVYPYMRCAMKRERARMLLEEHSGITPRNGYYTTEMRAAKEEFETRFMALGSGRGSRSIPGGPSAESFILRMVGVAQAVERRAVASVVRGSSPVAHPERQRQEVPRGGPPRRQGVRGAPGRGDRRHRRRPVQGHLRPQPEHPGEADEHGGDRGSRGDRGLQPDVAYSLMWPPGGAGAGGCRPVPPPRSNRDALSRAGRRSRPWPAG
jgi:hypothetical protein